MTEPIEFFEKRPRFKAMQYDGTNLTEIAFALRIRTRIDHDGVFRPAARIPAAGDAVIEMGYWVVVGQGEVRIVHPDRMERLFEPVVQARIDEYEAAGKRLAGGG